MARGGSRTPSKPAAVSGPGAHSARTDGGPSKGTAQMAAPGGGYGERKAIEDQAAAAPVNTGSGGPSLPASGGAPASAFGPTQRPDESISAGVLPHRAGPGSDGPNVDMALRALYSMFPTPYVGRLLRSR